MLAFAETRIETAPGAGFTINPPTFENSAEQLTIRGSVCRRAFAAGRPRYVRIDRLSADGVMLDRRILPIRGMPGRRGGCGFYSYVGSPLSDGQTARVGALRRVPQGD